MSENVVEFGIAVILFGAFAMGYLFGHRDGWRAHKRFIRK